MHFSGTSQVQNIQVYNKITFMVVSNQIYSAVKIAMIIFYRKQGKVLIIKTFDFMVRDYVWKMYRILCKCYVTDNLTTVCLCSKLIA